MLTQRRLWLSGHILSMDECRLPRKLLVKPSVELPEKDLPCVFTGMIFYVPTSVDCYSELKRYITAYDGDVVDEFNNRLLHTSSAHQMKTTTTTTTSAPLDKRSYQPSGCGNASRKRSSFVSSGSDQTYV
ncbi:uncharacterized protein LOC134177731 [Corticium candelabrum]|uniref:uncharacterized protein LOC134177731 n=1 Tax=Corticium candelabrum TaxID=121492 RepID=UPI002E2705FD|nr:uncharacterized protein LOC134177731 [Corticium candelabrum]